MNNAKRNEQCPCGSGKKFKKCCLAQTEAKHRSQSNNVANDSFAQVTKAIQHFENGNLQTAQDIALKILNQNPTNAEALHVLAAVNLQKGDLREAENILQKAIRIAPNAPHLYDSLGTTLNRLRRLEEAESAYLQAIKLAPKLTPHFYINLAINLHEQNKSNLAIEALDKAAELAPNLALIHIWRGTFSHLLGDAESASISYKRACDLEPLGAKNWNNLAISYLDLGKITAAMNACERAMRLLNNDRMIQENQLSILEAWGDVTLISAAYRRKLMQDNDPGLVISNALLIPQVFANSSDLKNVRENLEKNIDTLLQNPPTLTEPENQVPRLPFYHAYHGLDERNFMEKIAQLFLASCPSLSFTSPHCAQEKTRNQPLRIGFISRFFHSSVIAECMHDFMLNLIQNADEDFHWYFFSPIDVDDNYTKTLKKNAHKYVILPRNLAQARASIAAEEIDVLIYLDIGMDALTYYLAFAKLARIQAVLSGHPVTTGLKTIDVFLSSKLIEPENAQAHYTEKLVEFSHVPGCGPKPISSDKNFSRAELNLPESGNLYICPVAPHKIHPDFYQVFVEILKRDLAAQIILFAAHDDIFANQKIKSVLSEILPTELQTRIHHHDWEPALRFSAIIKHAAVVIDPWYFSMGSTAYLVLGNSIPAVTLPGKFMRGRGTMWLYRRLEIEDLIATSAENYIEIAIKTANNQNFRSSIIAKLDAKKHDLWNLKPATDETLKWLSSLEFSPKEQESQATENAIIAFHQGLKLKAENNFKAAIEKFELVSAAAPQIYDGWRQLINACEMYGDIDKAKNSIKKALEYFPWDGLKIRLALSLPIFYTDISELEENLKSIEQELTKLKSEKLFLQNPPLEIGRLPSAYSYLGKNARQFLQSYSALIRAANPGLSYISPHIKQYKKPAKKIRIAVISAHLGASILEQCNNSLFYHLSQQQELELLFCNTNSNLTNCLGELSKLGQIINLPNSLDDAQKIISSHECDIIFYPELGLNIFCYLLAHAKLAPIQFTSCGHPVTSGISTIDYYVSSRHIEPENATNHYSEKLVLLDYTTGNGPEPKLAKQRKSRSDLKLPTQGKLYICPSALYKIHPEFYQPLKEILQQDQNAQIILFPQSFESALEEKFSAAKNYIFSAELAKRVHLLKWQTPENFCEILLHADALLDAWNFSSGSTAYMALGLGLPMVTWPGEFMRGRGILGLYARLGIDEPIARQKSHYVGLAIKMANDESWRREISAKINARKNIIFDGKQPAEALTNWIKSLFAEKKPRAKPIQEDLFSLMDK
jgi:protein O-GlcNAc transferase